MAGLPREAALVQRQAGMREGCIAPAHAHRHSAWPSNLVLCSMLVVLSPMPSMEILRRVGITACTAAVASVAWCAHPAWGDGNMCGEPDDA
jgi:hypothetical protein